jgi:hypothetical protein
MKTIDITKNLIIIIIATEEKPKTENNNRKNHDFNLSRILSIKPEEKLFLKHHDFTICILTLEPWILLILSTRKAANISSQEER